MTTIFKLLSDLHLEFYERPNYMRKKQEIWKPTPSELDKNTVLLLAGDIHVGTRAQPWIEEMCDRFREVVYILGNHEFYHHDLHGVKERWRWLKMPDNFHFLDDDVIQIDDVRIIGGTLWTEVVDPATRWRGQQGMSDYHVIAVNYPPGNVRKLNVQDTNVENMMTKAFFEEVLKKKGPGKTIVMTHHLPHPLCVAPQFKNHPLNPFYMNNLDDLITKYDIDVWCHGHTHDNVDIHVGKTRILCNPMGYHGVALNQDFNEDLTFNV